MTPRTASFFEAMRGALAREIDVAEVEDRCGPASSTARLELVVRMVHAGRHKLLDGVYAATRLASELDGADAFERAARAHLEAEAGAEPDYASIALGFSDTLSEVGAAPWIAEVAEWEESLHRMRVVGAPAPRGSLSAPAIVRHYTFDVPAWTRAARAGEADAPTPAPTLVVLHRDPDGGHVRWFHPGAAHVGAIAEAVGDADAAGLAALGISREALVAARRDLAGRGLLGGSP